MFNADLVQVRIGAEPVAKGKLDQKNIAAAEFRFESIILSKMQLIAIRGIYKAISLNSQSGQESLHAPDFLSRLTRLAEAAGGDSPRPKCPDTSHITDVANRVGNDQLKAIFESKEQLAKQIVDWQRDRDLIQQRFPLWNQLVALLKFATDLPMAAEVLAEVTAIERDRKLLANPDPVPGMVAKLTGALRTALNAAHGQFSADHEARMAALEATPAWKKISQKQRYEILDTNRIRVLPTIAVGTTEEVLDTLKQTKLSELRAVSDALPTRFNHATGEAAKLLEPKAQHVHLPGGTIKNEDELKVWLAEAEECIRKKLKEGPVII